MDILLIGILLVWAIVATMIAFNLWTQNSQFEKEIQQTDEYTARVYTTMLGIFTKALDEMQKVDKSGAFSADDEVGFAFRVLIESIEQVKYELNKMQEPSDDETE